MITRSQSNTHADLHIGVMMTFCWHIRSFNGSVSSPRLIDMMLFDTPITGHTARMCYLFLKINVQEIVFGTSLHSLFVNPSTQN